MNISYDLMYGKKQMEIELEKVNSECKGLVSPTWLKVMGFTTTQHKMPGSKGTYHPNPTNTHIQDKGRGILGQGRGSLS